MNAVFLVSGIARRHDGVEGGENFIAQQRLQRGAIAASIRLHDDFVGFARARKEMIRFEPAIGKLDVHESPALTGSLPDRSPHAREAARHCRYWLFPAKTAVAGFGSAISRPASRSFPVLRPNTEYRRIRMIPATMARTRMRKSCELAILAEPALRAKTRPPKPSVPARRGPTPIFDDNVQYSVPCPP